MLGRAGIINILSDFGIHALTLPSVLKWHDNTRGFWK